MIGQGGGRELEMEKIVVGVGMIGQGGGSLLRSSTSQGVCAVVVFIAVLFWTFVWPWWRTQPRGGIGCSARVDMVSVSGFVCAVVVMVSDAECGGMWWSTGCHVVLFRLKWRPGL